MAKDNPKQSTEDPTHAAVVSIARQRGLGFRETDPLWKRKISEYLNAAQADYADPDKGFDWGTFDCCTFAFDWVQLITGVDPMQQFRGKYSTALTASRALKKIGAGSLMDTAVRDLGAPIPQALVQRGDLAWVKEGDCMGIVFLSGTVQRVMFLHEKALAHLYLKDCDLFFEVS